MQTVTLELTGFDSLKALQDLEQKHLIRIVKRYDADSYSLSGEPISEEDFKRWVEYAENSPTVNITEAKKRWATQKKKLQESNR